jgi:hypothetical protein
LTFEILDAHDGSEDHPTPVADGLARPEENEIHGFLTEREARRWFAGFLARLHRAGFVLALYEAPDCRISRHQVVFDSRTARHIRDKKLAR